MPILADSIEIKVDGKEIKDYQFSEIQLVQELQKPNQLRFCMHKDDLVQSENLIRFSLSKELMGKSVTLAISTVREDDNRKQQSDKLKFSGIIFNVNVLRKSSLAGAVIEVTAYSPDFLLMDNPHCFSYENENLKNIVAKTLEDYDIEVSNEPNFGESIPYTVQYNETDYAFMNRLASRFGEWLYYDGEKLVFGKIKKAKSLTLGLGYDVNDYHYQLNMKPMNFAHAHHNYLAYENTKKEGYAFTDGALHNLTDVAYKESKSLYKKETFQHLKSAVPEDSFNENGHSAQVQGHGKKAQMLVCYGSSIRADLRIGSIIKIEEKFYDEDKIAKCYHDELLICKITHTSDGDSNYENQFMAIPADCIIPPYSYADHYPKADTQRAVVMDNKDPEQLGRVRVQFLWQKEQDENLMTPWIRIAQPHGGNNKGFYFIPEIDEEVMVSFENGNAEKPYVTGTLYQGEQKPGENWYNDENNVKAIRTRNGHTIEIHDEGEGGFIKIYDNEKDNYILTFSTDDKLIKLESTGNIELYAENDIIIEAKNNINIKADKDMNREAGENINETAGENITVEAGADISESASENMTIYAGNDRKTDIGNNDTLTVNGTWDISVDSDVKMAASGNYTLEAKDILQDANGKMQLYSGSNFEQKADAAMKIDGGGKLEAKAGMVKIN